VDVSAVPSTKPRSPRPAGGGTARVAELVEAPAGERAGRGVDGQLGGAVVVGREEGNPLGEVMSIRQSAGEPAVALVCYARALRLYREFDRPPT
jgi:hypothetical protein